MSQLTNKRKHAKSNSWHSNEKTQAKFIQQHEVLAIGCDRREKNKFLAFLIKVYVNLVMRASVVVNATKYKIISNWIAIKNALNDSCRDNCVTHENKKEDKKRKTCSFIKGVKYGINLLVSDNSLCKFFVTFKCIFYLRFVACLKMADIT